jgi:hypothetical protein
MYPEIDNTDRLIVMDRAAARDRVQGPRVGDYVHMTDGTTRRFTHHWGDSIQTTCVGACAGGSFYLQCGAMNFSGALDSAIPISTLEMTDETREGSCWIFHHDRWQAHNAVHTSIPCRVYRQTA